jgi:hypothetical protein
MEVCEGRRTLTTMRTNQRLLNAHLWALHALFPQAQDVEIRRGGKRACIRSKIPGFSVPRVRPVFMRLSRSPPVKVL